LYWILEAHLSKIGTNVIDGCAAGRDHCDALATEENVISCGVAGAVSFGEDVAA